MNEELLKKETFKLNRKETYLYFLRTYNEFNTLPFDNDYINYEYQYVFKDERLEKFSRAYGIREQVKNNHEEIETFSMMLNWVQGLCSNVSPVLQRRFLNPFQIINYLKNGINMNCISYATLLNAAYLSCGFYSRNVWCLPLDISEIEIHVVTCVFSKKYQKWMFFDAANGIYCIDQMGVPYDLMQFRNALICGEKIRTITTSNWEKKYLNLNVERYLIYMSKNLFRFKSYNISDFDNEANLNQKRIICLNPSKYFPTQGQDWIKINNKYICQTYTSDEQRFWVKPS